MIMTRTPAHRKADEAYKARQKEKGFINFEIRNCTKKSKDFFVKIRKKEGLSNSETFDLLIDFYNSK